MNLIKKCLKRTTDQENKLKKINGTIKQKATNGQNGKYFIERKTKPFFFVFTKELIYIYI